MANAALALNSLPAERVRGCQLAQRFWNKAAMLGDNWTLTNDPTLNNGIIVDGVNQKAEHAEPINYVQSVSFWITLGSTTEDILQLSAAHSIEVAAGTLTATGWAAPTIYVNGVATATITVARSFVTVTTATAFNATDIAVGEVAAYGEFKMEDLKIWARGAVLTLQETLDYTNSATWNWENLLKVNLQFRTEDYDITNVRALDSSGYGSHFTLGDGSTSATYPTQGKGYMAFDGAMWLVANLAAYTGAWTIAFVAKRNAANLIANYPIDVQTGRAIMGWEAGIAGFAFYDGAWNHSITGAWTSSDTSIHSAVLTHDGSANYALYIDGVVDTVDVGDVLGLGGGVGIGGHYTGTSGNFVGNMYHACFEYFAMTPTQIAAYHISQMRVLGGQL